MFQGFAARCLIVEDIHSDIITLRPNAPWYSEEIRKQKSTYRKLERRWRRSKLKSDYRPYANQRTVIQNTIFKSEIDYYSNLISEAGNDNKALFRLIVTRHFATSEFRHQPTRHQHLYSLY